MSPAVAVATMLAVLAAGLSGCQQPASGPRGTSADAASRPVALPPDDKALADAALAAWLGEQDVIDVPPYRHAFVDLDADGTRDLLLWLDDPAWCADLGCTLLVFHGQGAGFRLVTQAGMVRPPIAVSSQSHAGWHDLLVEVGGGGSVPGTVALQHDGTGYPDDPTLMALLAPTALPRAQIVIE